MPIAKLTSRGRITLPMAVRIALGLDAGGQVDFVVRDDGFLLVNVHSEAASLKGRFAGRIKEPVSIEAMDRNIGEAVAARFRPS